MTWTAPAIDRRHEPLLGDERTMVEGWLDHHQDTLLFKCAGLSTDQLKRASVEPSNLTLLGLVRHMAEVERSSFRRRFVGEPVDPIYYSEENPDGDFDDVADADAEPTSRPSSPRSRRPGRPSPGTRSRRPFATRAWRRR